MSDANSKPVAGASEPHELEERALMAYWESGATGDGTTRDGIRAVLNLVRQEQENDDHRIEDNGIHRWWLSHTAPQEK